MAKNDMQRTEFRKLIFQMQQITLKRQYRSPSSHAISMSSVNLTSINLGNRCNVHHMYFHLIYRFSGQLHVSWQNNFLSMMIIIVQILCFLYFRRPVMLFDQKSSKDYYLVSLLCSFVFNFCTLLSCESYCKSIEILFFFLDQHLEKGLLIHE